VEPSTSVNRNVTTPEGAAAAVADTPAESHNRRAPTSHIGGIRPQTPAPRRGVARYPLAGSQLRYGTCWPASGDTILGSWPVLAGGRARSVGAQVRWSYVAAMGGC
jgi:hypothetical protein